MLLKIFKYKERSKRVLGMNSRNLLYIRPFNLRGSRKAADDKLYSKKMLKKTGLPVPKLLGKVENYHQLENFDWTKLPDSFVLKPNEGMGGEGITVVYGRNKKNGNWVKADKTEVEVDDLKAHIRNIFEGNYSLNSQSDRAFFEERVKICKVFKPYSYRGVPDIRIIVFNKVPVMAMLRLPTEYSGGKANLHLGGICVGVDIAKGVTTNAISRNLSTQQDYYLEYLPGTRLPLAGIKIPYWKEVLEIAIRCQEIGNLGFLGVDIMIDRDKGPVIAELNARPGLSIQNANLAPLRERLDRVAGLNIKSYKRGARLAQDLFGGEIEEEVEEITGKRVVGIFEKINIEGVRANKEVEAKLDTGAYYTSIDEKLAKEIGFEKTIEVFNRYFPHYSGSLIFPGKEMDYQLKKIREMREEHMNKIIKESGKVIKDINIVSSSNGVSVRPVVEVKITLDQHSITAQTTISAREHLRYPVIMGRKNLRSFIIDAGKIKEKKKVSTQT